MVKTYYEARIGSVGGNTIHKSESIEAIRKYAWNYLKKSDRKEVFIIVWRGKQPGKPCGIVNKNRDGIYYRNMEKGIIQWFKPNGTLYSYR